MSHEYLVVDGPMNGRRIAVQEEWRGFIAAVPQSPRSLWAGPTTGPDSFAPMEKVRYQTFTLAIPNWKHLKDSLQTVVINNEHIVPEGTEGLRVWATKEPLVHIYTYEALEWLKGRLR